MGARLRSWWQQIKQHSVCTVLIALLAVVIVLVLFGGYKFHWDWTGFNRPSKTLWDWLQLLGVLAVPVVVGFGAVWFTTRQGKIADAENTDNQRETALQAYIDKISELVLKEHLGELTEDGKLKPEYERVRNIARVRTITVLFQLDARRIGYVFAFLRESGLMSTKLNNSIISLSQADLRKINLSHGNLSQADLRGANLSEANLSQTDLRGANLSGSILFQADLAKAALWEADLSKAHLSKARLNGANLFKANLARANLNGGDLSSANLYRTNLVDADLSGANLTGAKVSNEQLKEAKSLKGAIMPDGSKYH